MNNMDELFPQFQRSIENLIEDEEGNIPGKKLLMLGTMVVILGSIMSMDVFAGHRSHRSHSSHRSSRGGHSSHGSHSNHGSSTHGSSHESHQSHQSHQSKTNHTSGSYHGSHNSHHSHSNTTRSMPIHSSHTSHSNTAVHSNSKYSAEGDVTYKAPAASKVPTITTPVVKTTEDMFKLPDVNENIEMPNGTPTSGIMASMEMPSSSTGSDMDLGDVNTPSSTDEIR